MVKNMNDSIWKMDGKQFDSLEENTTCDICIVGGGLTGISLAYYLKDCGKKVLLIEQNRLGCSTTARSTAKLTYLQKDMLSKIKKQYGVARAREYFLSQKEAVEEVVKIIQKEKISCHLEKSPSYLFVQESKSLAKLSAEYELYKKVGANVSWADHLPIDCGEQGCFFAMDTYVFHPLEYLYGLVSKILSTNSVEIYENTRMTGYQRKNDHYFIQLQNGHTIESTTLIFAGHYPPFVLPYLFPIKVSVQKEVVRTEKDQNRHFNAINLDNDIFSIRYFQNQKIRVVSSKMLGNTGIKEIVVPSHGGYAWSNYDLMSASLLPIVGWVGSKKSGLYLATGYNAWGMTNSNLAARIIADEIQSKRNAYAKLCDPYLNSLTTLLKKVGNVFSNIYHFTLSYFPDSSPAHVRYEKGKRVGVIVGSHGKTHKVALTCPHLKCGLRYNAYDETWDCPCHGSRFDLDGNLLRGPATDCVKIYEEEEEK